MKDAKTVVQSTYTEVVQRKTNSCCSPEGCVDPQLPGAYQQLEGYLSTADYGLGCGIPVAFDRIQAGDTVLDLGSGAGNDVFIARQQVGSTGEVIGLDFTPAMVQKAEENRQRLGFENVRFVLGDIEAIPLPSESVDIVISNCVLNLVPDKKKAFQEIFRVLKKGGRFVISDMVGNQPLPERLRTDAALYASCFGGVLPIEEYTAIPKALGFQAQKILDQKEVSFPEKVDPGSIIVYSITLEGEKPGGDTNCC